MGKIIVFIAVIVLVVGGYMYFSASSRDKQKMETVTPTPVETGAPSKSASSTPSLDPVSPPSRSLPPTPASLLVKEFVVTGGNFKFDLSEIRIQKGDTVKIVFKNAEGFHDLVIDEFKVRTQQIAAGKEETIQFVADKVGTFEYYCSVGSHRQMGMKGKLIVEEE